MRARVYIEMNTRISSIIEREEGLTQLGRALLIGSECVCARGRERARERFRFNISVWKPASRRAGVEAPAFRIATVRTLRAGLIYSAVSADR